MKMKEFFSTMQMRKSKKVLFHSIHSTERILKYIDPATEESFYATEHSIGNLVLLYRDDNSTFNADDFESKKRKFFENVGVSMFKSRHLIHTISIFSSSKWEGEDIAKNKKNEISKFNEQFNKYLNNE